MKLRLPHKFQAALMAALASVSFTVQQAQASTAAELNTALGELITLNNYVQGADYTFSYTLTTVGTNGTNSILKLASDYYFATQQGTYGGLSANAGNVSGGWPNTTSHEANLNVWNVSGRLAGWISRDANGTGTGGSSLSGSTITVKYSADTNTTTFELYHKNKATTDRVIMTGVALNAGDFSFGTMTSAGTDLVFRSGKDYVWNGTDGNATWNAANNNWLDGETAAALASTGNALFTANGAVKSVTIGENVTAKNMAVQDNYTFVMGGYTVNVTAGMELASGKTLTLDGAGTLNVGANIAGGGNITKTGGGTLNLNASANLGTLTVESANTLTVQSGTVSVTTLAGAGVLDIASGAVVANSSATAFSGVKLAGSGTYALKPGSTTLTAGLGDNWTGIVRVTDLDANGSRNMSGLRTSLSTLELKGFNGWMSNWTGTLDYNIKLTNGSAGYGWRNGAFGGDGSVMNNTGIWSGNGKFVAAVNSGRYMDYTYSGNISAWTGEFELLNGTTKLKFSSNATDVKAKITQTGGALKLYADTDVAFSNTITATSLDVTANKSAKLNGATVVENGITLNTGSSLTVGATGSLQMGGTVTFAHAPVIVEDGGTVSFANTVVFNLDTLDAVQQDNKWVYTLFSGSGAVTMSSLSESNLTITGGTLGKKWDFTTPNQISYTISPEKVWSAIVGDWNYTDTNWNNQSAQFKAGDTAVFTDDASATVQGTVRAGGITVTGSNAAGVNIGAGTDARLSADAVHVDAGNNLVTVIAIEDLQDFDVRGNWTIDADQTLGAGTINGGVLTISKDKTATLTNAENSAALLRDIVGSGNIKLTADTFFAGSTTESNVPTTHATGTLIVDGVTLSIGSMNTGGYNDTYVDMSSFKHVQLDGGTLYIHNNEFDLNGLTVVNGKTGTVQIYDTKGANDNTLNLKGTTQVDGTLTFLGEWKQKFTIDALGGTGEVKFQGVAHDKQIVDLKGGTIGKLTTDGAHPGTVELNVTGNLAVTNALTIDGGTVTLSADDVQISAIDLGNGTLNIAAGTTTVSGNVKLGYGSGKASGTLTVAQGATLTADKVQGAWGYNTFTVNGTINANTLFEISTDNVVRNVTGSGTINTKELQIGNQTGNAIFSGGLTINVGDTGITGDRPLELRDVTVGVLDDSNGWSASRAITLGDTTTGTTFDIDANKEVTLSGVLSGSGKLNVTGGGTLALNGANTFSGGLTVTGATVEMGHNNALGNANNAITIGQGGVIDLKGHDNVTYAYTLAGGTLQNTGNPTGAGMKQTKGLTLTANSTIGGTGDFQIIAGDYAATTINLGSNTLAKTGDNTVHFVNSTITEGTLQVDAGALDFRTDHGISTVKANIVLNGGGTALTGGFKYADSETAVSRALTANQDVTASAAIEIGSNVTLATNVATGQTLTMSGALTGNGGLTKTGDGTLALTAAASYNGNTAVNAGNLALGSSLTTTGDVTVAADAGITFANGATITANSLGLEAGSTLDFSAYQGAIGSKVNVVTTTTGVTGFGGATIVKPAISVHGLTTEVKQEDNNIVLTFTPEAEGTMHLYILTGQSNSLGSVKGNPAPADLFAHYASGGLLYNGNMHKGGSRYITEPDWKIVDVQPKGEGDASYAVTGPEYVFEYLMLKNGWFSTTPDKDSLGVIKASLDGGGDEYWKKGQSGGNYEVILDTVTKGYQEAAAMGYANVTIDGLLYLQGESNGHGGVEVQTNYTNFLANLKADLEAAGIDTTKILFGEHSVLGEPATWGQTDTSVGNEKTAGDTHTQLENLAKATEGIDFVYTRDLDKITSGDNLGVHYNGEAQLTIGARYAYAFAVQNGKDVRYNLDNDKKGVVRGSNDEVALTDTAAWWGGTAPAETQVAVWDVSSVSTPSPAVQLQGYGNYIADGATWSVGGIHVADAYKQMVTINGGTVSLGADGINLVGGGLSMTSDVSARESQSWQAANGHKLAVNGTTTIDTGAKLTLADGLYLTFGYITGTGSLEIGTVTFDMDLDYMGTMGQASYISSKGPGANGYVSEVNLIDLTAGSGTISFTHGGGVNDITKRGGLADCTLALGDNDQTLKVTMPSTAPKTVYFTRSGEVVYTADDDGENGIYKATELVLSGQQDSPATLTLSTALKSGVGIKAEGLGGTVKIDSDVVLNASSLETDGAPVSIAGSGEYVGHAVGSSAASVSAADVLGQGVTLASDWTGSVVLSGGNASFSSYTSMNGLGDFFKADSTIVFNGLYAYFSDSYTIGADIEFRGTGEDGTGAALTYTAGNNKTVELSGTVTGKGDFVFDKNGTTQDAIKFTGDIAGWNGTITTGNHNSATLNLTFGGSVTDVNAAITKGQNHPINVTVDATNAVSFNAALTNLNNLTLNASKSASVLGGISTNAATLNAGASLTIGGADTTNSLGTVTVNGTGSSLTINQAATITGVTLSNNASTTVTNNVAGTNLGNVALNNNTALTIAGTAAVAAGNVKVNDQCAATITLGNDFSMDQLDTIGANKTLSIASEQGMTKTLTTGALGFDNVGTVISLQNVNMVVTGAATAGVLDAHTNNQGTMSVGSGATLNLQGTTQWNTDESKYVDLVISDGGAVNVTGGTENTLRGVNLGANSSLTFGADTATTIGGAVVLANTITNDGSVTLSGTVNLDALTADYEAEGYRDGKVWGNGFYVIEADVRVFTAGHVGTVNSGDATITFKNGTGTIDEDGLFHTEDEILSTFYVKKEGSTENYTTAFDIAGELLTTVSLDDTTTINLDKADAALAHLVLTEDASATVQVSENATIASVEGVGAGQTLTVAGTTGKVLTLSADNTMEGTVDVQGGTLKTTTGTTLGNAHVDVAAAGTLELGANLTLANGMDNAGTVNLTNKALTLNGREGGTAYTMGTLSNGASSDVTLNNHVTATFDKDASVRRLTGNAGSAVVVGENATLTLTSTNRNSYYSLVGDLDVQGTLKLKGSNGDIRLAGYEDDQVFNLGHLDIDGASGTSYILTSGSVNYTTDIVVKSLSGGGASHTLFAATCYNGNDGTGQVVDLFLGESQDHNNLYEGTIQYGIGTKSAKAGSGMNVVLKDELVASKAVLETTFSGGTSATVTVDTERAQVKGLKDASTGKTVKVSGKKAEGSSDNRVLEIVGNDNYTYNGKLGANLDVVHSGSGTQSFGGVDGFNGSIDVEAGILNIMNAASVSAQDVTINNSTLGVYNGSAATADTDHEGVLTVATGHTLTASGENAKLNANLVMESGSTLDVSAYGGMGGLHMGSSITLNPGMFLSDKDMEGVANLGFMDAYDLYFDVNEFSIGTTPYSEITFDSETWVKASEIFTNTELDAKDYYVFYSGVNPGGNGGNVGTIYIVQVPEPTTSTLSLLALCALAARRRRKA